MNKPKVGDELYLVNAGVNVRVKPADPEWCKVTKVGRKYFTIKSGWREIVFTIDGYREKSEYVSDWDLYESKTVYENKVETDRWMKAFKDKFSMYSNECYSLVELQDAGKILGISISC